MGVMKYIQHMCIVNVMKMGNITHRARIEPTFRASVLTITPPRICDEITLSTSNCKCGSLPERSVQTTGTTPWNYKSFNWSLLLTSTYRYIYKCSYTQGRLNNHKVYGLYRTVFTDEQCRGGDETEQESTPHTYCVLGQCANHYTTQAP